MESRYESSVAELRSEVTTLKADSGQLELELETTKSQYASLQESYRNSVDVLGRRLCEISGLMRAHQETEEKLKLNGTISAPVEMETLPKLRSEEMEEGNRASRKKAAKKKKKKATRT